MPQTPDYDDLAARVADGAVGVNTALEVAGALQQAAGDPDEDPIGPLICAFNYDLVSQRNSDRREQHGVFAPIVEWDGAQFPPPLADIDDDWLTTWAEVVDRSEAPVVVARLNDLLWERRVGERPDQRARRAIDSYLAMRESEEPMVAPDALTRALELARGLRDVERVPEISALIVDHARGSIEAEEWEPGVALILIEALIELPAGDRPEGLDELLEEVKTRYQADPYIVQSTTELQAALRRDQPEQEQALHAEAVERFRQAAGEASGILRVAHFQHALEIARQYGLREQMEDLRRELQEVRPEDLDLKEVSAEIALPTEQIERLIEQVAGGGDWPDCLERFAVLYGPPSGAHDKNVELIHELKARSPLLFMIPRVEFAPEGTTLRELRTEEEHVEGALAQQERDGIVIWSLIAADTLVRILERHGEPSEEELGVFFESSLIPADLAKQLAHGVSLFARGAYDDSAHALTPRIERAVREVCRRAGLVVSREPIGSEPGGVRPLGHLLAALEGILDESWRRYLVNTLTEPLGVNLRNRIAHGLIGEAQAHDAALLVHVAAFLRTLQAQERRTDASA
jgi:Domain of unknown function (DUF4209)